MARQNRRPRKKARAAPQKATRKADAAAGGKSLGRPLLWAGAAFLAVAIVLVVATTRVFDRETTTSPGAERDPPPAAASDPRPSVLLITLDTTRADHLGCYGYPKPVSENLDRLAAGATVFTRAIVQAAVTPVSHASIFTGLNPYSHGLRVMHGLTENRLADSRVTLAEVLRDAGYETAAFVSAFPVTERFGLHQGFETFDADFLRDPPERLVADDGSVNTGRNQRSAAATSDRALRWLETAPEPFFLWLHYFDPHDPVMTPPRAFVESFGPLPGGEREQLRALYDIEIAYMDRHLGRVIDALERRGTLEEMVVVVIADHGEGLGDHDWWTHGILYQEQIRVPLIIRAPGKPGGRRLDVLVRSIDVMPTVLELVGAEASLPPVEGRSLVALLDDATADPQLVAYADSLNVLTYTVRPTIADKQDDMLFALMRGPWKYIHHRRYAERSELYDLDRDRREEHNLYASHPELVRTFQLELGARRVLPGQRSGRERMSEEDRERLEALGYVDE
ncbi:MAG: sulfatase-like hydrolase/transferase [bacterium]|nr:sulfatase-like hydrolase/transferase [bacterium]